MVVGVRDVHVARRVDHNVGRVIERRARARATVTTEALCPGARDRGNDASARDPQTHTIVPRVCDVDAARRVDGDAVRVIERRAGARAAVAEETRRAGARDRGDDASARDPEAHAMVVPVRDVDVSLRVDGDAGRVVERRARAHAAVAAETPCPGARDRGDDARARDPQAHAMVVGVSDVDVARRVDCNAYWIVECRARARAAVAAEVLCSGARDRGDDARARDPQAHAIVVGVRDVDVARRVNGDALRIAERGARARAAVAAEARCSGARNRGDDARVWDPQTHAMVSTVRDVYVARSVQGDTPRIIERRARARAAVAAEARCPCARDRGDDTLRPYQ